MHTIWELLERGAAATNEAPAVFAPGQSELSYGELWNCVRRVARALRRRGIEATDVVAIVMPNGSDMALAFLAVGSCCAAAPLNPGYPPSAFDFYLGDLGAKAVIVGEGSPQTIRDAIGIEILEWASLVDEDGEGPAIVWPDASSTALLLHTSGTTSQPKLVPLTQRNLLASARNIAGTLQLTASDRCLNIMPLFHIHGIAAALLASLYAGASVVCSDGVFAKSFFAWMDEFRPTWYTAVPTMHQGILRQGVGFEDVVRRVRLRFIRSSSAALPPPVMFELEAMFGAPVVEAYGMTEAAHQMCCNPLPPFVRKAGSVGLPAGPEVAVMDEFGKLLGAEEVGEVVIRGENVTSGYVANASANESAFAHGWFHTGDQGRLDTDGYLHLTGRLKEMINRGGEKLAPREIDEALLEHPAVQQALAFSMPHAQLGEDVGAAIELREGFTATEQELRDWVAGRLASFQVPRVIRIVDKIPTGATGKLQRIGLAEKLGVTPIDDAKAAAYVAPRNGREAAIAALWARYFPGKEIGVETRFEALGGDSLLAMNMLTELERELGGSVSMQRFVAESTVACLAREMRSEAQMFVPLRVGKGGAPLLCLPGHDGSLLGLTRMAAAMNGDAAVWAIDWRRRPEAKNLSELVAQFVALWREKFPQGPYRLAGVCMGGPIAWEMAHQLMEAGERVETLCLIDALNPAWRASASRPEFLRARAGQIRSKVALHREAILSLPWMDRVRYVRSRAAAFRKNYAELAELRWTPERDPATQLWSWVRQYRPRRLDVVALLVRLRAKRLDAPSLGWESLAGQGIELLDIPYAADGALSGDNALRVAAILDERFRDG